MLYPATFGECSHLSGSILGGFNLPPLRWDCQADIFGWGWVCEKKWVQNTPRIIYMGGSENRGKTPKSSILIRFSMKFSTIHFGGEVFPLFLGSTSIYANPGGGPSPPAPWGPPMQGPKALGLCGLGISLVHAVVLRTDPALDLKDIVPWQAVILMKDSIHQKNE